MNIPRRGLLPSGVSARARFSSWVCLGFALSGCGGSSSSPQTYSLNATVSGLTSSGLVVTANGTDVTVPVGTASFSQQLGASILKGTAYSVTVKQQPTGQMCSVAGGTGTIGSADVANVVVTCSNEAFALGGSIAGLTVSGLILANAADTSRTLLPACIGPRG